jgi:hypothetical protein
MPQNSLGTTFEETFKAHLLYFTSIVRTFFIEKDAEILSAHYTWKVAFTNLIHKQSIEVKL